ncbi:MAG: HD domain-containing protein [Gammaproteobacteria bacterium]|nr:HD domain-containing protein [Gammaproteobacteria bacterium]
MPRVHEIDSRCIDEPVLAVCRAVRDAGGRALLVGGGVRDRLMGVASKDYDLEVYGLPAELVEALLKRLGQLNTVGVSFTVYKVRLASQLEVDVSLPRRESKVAPGHRGFTVRGDPFMSFEEAAGRRDFTINAILYDPLESSLIDPFGGVADLERGVIRAVSYETFGEDSLRVLRAMQFAARFEFEIEPDTQRLCRAIDLSDLAAERIFGEFDKALLLARRPSLGLVAARDLLILDKLLPDLKALVGCPQDRKWHPEGDVFTHTLMALDNAAELTRGLPREKRLTVMLSVLLHDVAKPGTTKIEDGRVRSLGHDQAAQEPTLRVLDTLNVHTVNGYDVRAHVVALVAHHLKPMHFYHDRRRISDGAFRRLARVCDLELLYLVAKADALARGPASDAKAQEWFIERARRLGVEHRAPEPILMGRHLRSLGVEPGPRMGEVLKTVYEMQLDDQVTDLDEAIQAARRLIGSEDRS